jgi:hypothetical protein
MIPAHQRLAELWTESRRRQLTDDEVKEFDQCHAVNAKYCWDMAHLENLSEMASMTNDVTWQHNICSQIDELQISGRSEPEGNNPSSKEK